MIEIEPVAWLHKDRPDADVVTNKVKYVWGEVAVGLAAYSIPLYEESVVLALQERIAGLEAQVNILLCCLRTVKQSDNEQWE